MSRVATSFKTITESGVLDCTSIRDDDTTWDEVEGRDCTITIEPRPRYCDRGNWIAKLHPRGELALEIDGSDGWPRYYFSLDRMMEEIGAWLKKRGQL